MNDYEISKMSMQKIRKNINKFYEEQSEIHEKNIGWLIFRTN